MKHLFGGGGGATGKKICYHPKVTVTSGTFLHLDPKGITYSYGFYFYPKFSYIQNCLYLTISLLANSLLAFGKILLVVYYQCCVLTG